MGVVTKDGSTRQIISGFVCYFMEQYIVFLNSAFTLGHERFTAAHELYHLEYEAETLRQVYLVQDSTLKKRDEKADVFAAEFLMPKEGIDELFCQLVDVLPSQIEPKHIIRMAHAFKVSYSAMAKRLVELGLCEKERLEYLRNFGSVENVPLFRSIVEIEGIPLDLFVPSKVSSIPMSLVKVLRENYERGIISYQKLAELLSFIEKSPAQLGYSRDEE